MTCNYNGSRMCKRGVYVDSRLCGRVVRFKQRKECLGIIQPNVVFSKQGRVGGAEKAERLKDTIDEIIGGNSSQRH